MSKKISDKDKKDWKDFISSKERVENKDENLVKKKISSPSSYDLHGYSLEEANEKIKDIIIKSYNTGISKLTIITGKGIHSENEKNPYVSKNLGILKYSVPDYIKNNNDLMKLIIDIKDANYSDGGSGAFYIFLRRKKL